MHHLSQTKKLLRDLRQSDFHSSAAQGWGDDWSAELHFPGDLCIPLSCHAWRWQISRALSESSFLVSAGWFLAAWMRGKSLHLLRDEQAIVSFFPLGSNRTPALVVVPLGCHAHSGQAGKVFHHPSPEPSSKKGTPLSHPWKKTPALRAHTGPKKPHRS